MTPLPRRPRLALPFTILPVKDGVHLVAGEDFRFTLSAPSLESWLPGWLVTLDGKRSLDEALATLSELQRLLARSVLERLHGERLLVGGLAEDAHRAGRYRMQLEGTGPMRAELDRLASGVGGESLPRSSSGREDRGRDSPPTSPAASVRILCQDRLDWAAALDFNSACLEGDAPWLWVSTGAMSRGYVSPVFLPDAGPCLACLLAHFRYLSPAPGLYDDLLAHARQGGGIEPVPFPAPGAAVLAGLAMWKVQMLGEVEPRTALYRLHVLETATLETTAHTVLIDPECGACRNHR
jgi:bacteriocin biosynthesis cyclodehydratase domain-containing protein